MTVNTEKFEELLSAELKATLDGERGKAVAAFRGYVAAQEASGRRGNGGEDGRGGTTYQPDFRKPRRGGGQISRREAWMWTAAPSLAAACLGIVLTLQVVGRNGTPVAGPVAAPGNGQVAGNVPKDTIQWVDPNDHAIYRLTQPVEKAGFQELKPF